jgi:hypothetical protein
VPLLQPPRLGQDYWQIHEQRNNYSNSNRKASKFGAKLVPQPVLRNFGSPKIEVSSERCEWFVLQERLQEPELTPMKKHSKKIETKND